MDSEHHRIKKSSSNRLSAEYLRNTSAVRIPDHADQCFDSMRKTSILRNFAEQCI
jgi:hypothetical protein